MKHKASLKKLMGIPATLLIPLRGRYLEHRRAGGIIKDPKSVEIMDAIDHDFAERELPWDTQIMISVRTEILDQAIKEFLVKNPDAVIVNLGCGLDTRVHRVDNGRVHWYDLDLPECIEIRRKFFQENDRFTFIEKSILDFSWTGDIEKGRKTLFIAEGLLIYFSEEDVRKIISVIKERFPASELLCEAYSKLMRRSWHKHPHLRKALSMFKWNIKTGRLMEKWEDGIRFVNEWHYFDRYPRRWRWMSFFRFIRPLKKMMKIVHLRFTAQHAETPTT